MLMATQPFNATQPFDADVYVKGPLTVGTDLAGQQIKATLHLQQPQDESQDLARLVRANSGGLQIDVAEQSPQVQGLTATAEPGKLSLNPVGGDLHLGSTASWVSVAGDLHLQQKLFVHRDGAQQEVDLLKQPLHDGELPGPLTVAGNLTVTGTINGRTLAADGETLERCGRHIDNRDNPHGVTAVQVKALALDGGTLNGSLEVKGKLALGPFAPAENPGPGALYVTGKCAAFSFVDRELSAWPPNPQAGDLLGWYNQTKSARLWTEESGDVLTISAAGDLTVGGQLDLLEKSRTPLRFSSAYSAQPDRVANAAEISNDVWHYKTLMIVGNRSRGIVIQRSDGKAHTVRSVSVWDRLEVRGPESRTGQLFVDGDLTITGNVRRQLADNKMASLIAMEKVAEATVPVPLTTFSPILSETSVTNESALSKQTEAPTDLHLKHGVDIELTLAVATDAPLLVMCEIADENSDAEIYWSLGTRSKKYLLNIYGVQHVFRPPGGFPLPANSVNVHYQVYRLTVQ